MAAGAAAARAFEGVTECAPRPAHAPSHACVRALHKVPATCHWYSDEDEVMAGKENFPMQEDEGGGGSTGGIKKRGHRGGTKEFKAERRKPNTYGDKVTRTTEGLTALARSD